MSGYVQRPCVSPVFAGKLAKKFYNFAKITEIKEFGSYSDRNFYIRGQRTNLSVSQDHDHDHDQTKLENESSTEGEFVLKILNSDDSKHGDFVDAENEAIGFLRDRDFPCPLLYPVTGSSETKLHIQVPLSNDLMNEASSHININVPTTEECIMRLLSFLPGVNAATLGYLSHENLFFIGQFVGKMSRAFQEFQCPVLNRRLDRWSMENFLSLEEYIAFVKGEENKNLAREVLGRFATHVTPKFSLLRRGIVHSDVTGTNLLIDINDSSFKISGLIDFCDVRHSWLLFEIATTVASFIKEDDVLTSSGHLIAGYQSVFPLPGLEFELLYDFVSARLCQVLLITYKEAANNPENEYLNVTVKVYFANFKAWLKNSKDEVVKHWRKMGLDMNPLPHNSIEV